MTKKCKSYEEVTFSLNFKTFYQFLRNFQKAVIKKLSQIAVKSRILDNSTEIIIYEE